MIAASWAISVYFAYQRTWKPFNPILGETYELTNHNGITFLAEQVSFQSLCVYVCLVQFHNQSFCLIQKLSHMAIEWCYIIWMARYIQNIFNLDICRYII
jgi:hypothetical protein